MATCFWRLKNHKYSTVPLNLLTERDQISHIFYLTRLIYTEGEIWINSRKFILASGKCVFLKTKALMVKVVMLSMVSITWELLFICVSHLILVRTLLNSKRTLDLWKIISKLLYSYQIRKNSNQDASFYWFKQWVLVTDCTLN